MDVPCIEIREEPAEARSKLREEDEAKKCGEKRGELSRLMVDG